MAPWKIESLDLASLDIDALRALVLQLLARNADLEARLEAVGGGSPPKTPDNSSLPPSSARKANVGANPSGRGGKKRRKGRPGKARELHPNPDRTIERYREAMRLRRQTVAGRPAAGSRL